MHEQDKSGFGVVFTSNVQITKFVYVSYIHIHSVEIFVEFLIGETIISLEGINNSWKDIGSKRDWVKMC